jgi:ArsR family transcriptional regulator, arsenate/arsenite/antimonite-responsive transcriptional repressor
MEILADFFGLLSDQTRLRILVLLAQSDLFVCEICGLLNLSQPKISRHLSKLKDLGYVKIKKDGKFVLYSLELEDPTRRAILDSIIKNLDHYPILTQDKFNLLNHDDYVVGCSPRGTKIRIND